MGIKVPKKILQTRGSWRGRIGEDEVNPSTGRPDCPHFLNAQARSKWNELVPQLEDMNVLTRIDQNALARYCQIWTRWKRAEEFLDENGDTYAIADSEWSTTFKAHPQVAIAAECAGMLSRLEKEFGLTPAARSGLKVSVKSEKTNGDKGRFFAAG